jgi:hypothetical protein
VGVWQPNRRGVIDRPQNGANAVLSGCDWQGVVLSGARSGLGWSPEGEGNVPERTRKLG